MPPLTPTSLVTLPIGVEAYVAWTGKSRFAATGTRQRTGQLRSELAVAGLLPQLPDTAGFFSWPVLRNFLATRLVAW